VSNLPTPLKDREFISRLFRKNLKRWFFEPRHWRLAFGDIKEINIQFLNFSPPQYDFIILTNLPNGQTLQFYEGVVAKETLEKAERLHGKTEIGTSTVYFVDGYTNLEYMENLLEAWCRQKKPGSLGFAGQFLGIRDKAHVQIEALKPIGKPGQEVTTNYLYRCKGWVETSEQKLDFDVVAKRFLPRTPLNRGNSEYAMLRALPSSIVPKTRGALVNRRLRVNDENQVLVLFTDYIEDALEVGEQIWELMEQISEKKGLGKSPGSELKLLETTVQEAIDKVVFPFHRAGFETWHSNGVVIKQEDEFYKWYHGELEQNLAALKAAKIITASHSETLSKIFSRAWDQILSRVKATEIHRDLMWRQILKTKDKQLIILDLDEHVMGHAGKDLADLCAANRFIAEDLQSPHTEYMLNIAENLNKLILKRYIQNAEKINAVWTENLEKTVLVYLAYRHFHDAAYYAPAWRQAKKAVERRKYRRYVGFSFRWLEKSIKPVEDLLR